MASSLVRTGFVRGSSMQGHGCYEHRCSNQTLEVAVDGVWQTCPIGGGPIQFNGFNGLFLDLQRLVPIAEIHSFIFHFCLTLKNQCKNIRNRIVGTTTWTSLMEKPLKE
jgi:hypothetical protein